MEEIAALLNAANLKAPVSSDRTLGEQLADSLRPLTSSGRTGKAGAEGRLQTSGGSSRGEVAGGVAAGEHEGNGQGELVRRLLITIERLQTRLAAAEGPSDVSGGRGGAAGTGGVVEAAGAEAAAELGEEVQRLRTENAKLRTENMNMYHIKEENYSLSNYVQALKRQLETDTLRQQNARLKLQVHVSPSRVRGLESEVWGLLGVRCRS